MKLWKILLVTDVTLHAIFMTVSFGAYMLMSYMASNHLGKVEGELRDWKKEWREWCKKQAE